MTTSRPSRPRSHPGRRGSLARRTASLLTALAFAVLPTAALPVPVAAAAETGANFIATGHDQDWHCSQGGSSESCDFLRVSVDLVRKGSTLPVLSIDSGTITTEALELAGVTPVVVADPSDAAAFNAIPLVDGSGAKLYSAIVVGSSWYVADISESDSATINARSTDIRTFFNAGGGILAQSGAGMPGYYDFVPITINAVDVNPPFTPTTRGAGLGITAGMVNCCATHNSFSTPTDPVVTLETDAAGTATTIAAFDAKISDGGFTAAPVVTITGGDTVWTADTTPTVTGTTDAPAGTTVTVTVGGQTLSTTVAAGGAWSVTPTALGEGSYPVVASVTVAGKTGTGEQTIVVDTTAPTVTIDGAPERATNDPTPTVSGTTTAPVGSTVTVTVADQTLTATVVDGGTWSVTAATLAEGTYTVSATAVDQALNVSTPATQSLTVDLTPPGVGIDGGEAAGTHHGDERITGTSDAPAGSIVTVTVGGQTLTGTVTDAGTWSVTPVELPEGGYTVSASVTDAVGNVATATQRYTVDTTPPALTIDGPTPAFATTSTPTVSGTTDAPAGTTVLVVIGSLPPLTATVTDAGTWSVTPEQSLPDGDVEISATVFDEVENVTTVTRTLTVDTVAPLLTVTGGSRVATNDATPTVSGTTDAAAGTTVTVTVDGVPYAAVVGDDQRWSVTPGTEGTGLTDGEHSVSVSVSDPAGNTTTVTQALVVDREAPSLSFDVAGSVVSATKTPTFTGTSDAPAGSRVVVTAGTAVASGTVSAGGTWSVVLPALDDGEYVVRATVTDEADNTSSEAQLTLVVDTTAPVGAVTSPALTGSPTPTISGTTDAPVGSTVLVAVDDGVFETVVREDGTWALTLEVELGEGEHTVVVGFVDAALNTGTATQVLTVDTTPPAGEIDGGATPLGNSATPVISGTTDAPAGSTVTVTVEGFVLTATVGADGTWSVTVPEPGLDDGDHPVTVVVTDPAGNASAPQTQTLTIDTVAPQAAFDDGDAVTVGTASFTISGTTDAPAGSPVVVTVGGRTLTTTVADDGSWSVEVSELPEGSYTVQASFTDAAGNVSVLDQALTVAAPTTTPPTTPAGTTPEPTTPVETTPVDATPTTSTPAAGTPSATTTRTTTAVVSTTTTRTSVTPLAYTGAGIDTTAVLTGGLGLLVVGVGFALVGRRRRGDHT
ncbi:Ig-like domain-containing protein [Nakamurella deserti]|uniref:Ig-like domain-containing protein n=1 Tax=Nakamurella deserti TaxID=2164074 RepID=UPI000DBE42CE|nr:Ig-like domain-containing protein [Nakamurella deserti]